MEKSKYAGNFCELTGQQFGRLKVLSLAESKHGCSYWFCQCECGVTRVVRGRHLKTGRARSCGCWNKELHRELLLNNPISESLELAGQKFGRLTVIAKEKSKHGRSRWLCVCDCNVQVITSGKNLRDGKKKSCGCLRREMNTLASQFPQSTRIAYTQYRCNAERDGREFSLSREQFTEIIERECLYCGQEKSCGIDRTDNSAGYTTENSVPCCQRCNLMKRTQSVDEFLKHCVRVANHQNHKKKS